MSETPENKTNNDKVSRFFGLRKEGSPTEICIAELTSGNISIQLHTKRVSMEPLVTTMTLAPSTFELLSDAIFTAAHGQGMWQIPKDEVSE